MKIRKIEFSWNESITNPSDVISIEIEEGANKQRQIVLEGSEAEKFILDIEALVNQYRDKGEEFITTKRHCDNCKKETEFIFIGDVGLMEKWKCMECGEEILIGGKT